VKEIDENNGICMMEDNQQDLNYKCRVAENEAYRCVMRYIQCELFQTPKVVKLTQLTNMLKDHMLSLGVEIRGSTKKHLWKEILEICCT